MNEGIHERRESIGEERRQTVATVLLVGVPNLEHIAQRLEVLDGRIEHRRLAHPLPPEQGCSTLAFGLN